MAYIQAEIRSELLAQNMSVSLFFPNDADPTKSCEPKAVIYLLHGMTGNSQCWFSLTSAQRYASDNSIILVAPQAHNSFYADMATGEKYFTYITEELPAMLKSIFNIPTEREKTFVAGFSMGGYGAMLVGLSRPDLYAGCATFSGAVGVATMNREIDANDPFIKRYMVPILGADLVMREELDLTLLAQKVAALPADERPKILSTCGFEDFLYEGNVMFKTFMQALPLEFKYMEWTGDHEWGFWDKSLVYAIDYFLDNGYAEKIHQAWAHTPKIESN